MQEEALRDHCKHARFVWNLAAEQQSWWRPGRRNAPGLVEQCRQLTQARGEHGWLATGSVMVQQQALRDYAQAMTNYFRGTHGKPSWRKAGRDEGFRIVAHRPGQVRKLNRHWGQVFVPKAGWVRFRWSRAVPEARSYRVKLDRAGRWHVAFAAVLNPIAGPGTWEVVGVDRGIAVSAAPIHRRNAYLPAAIPIAPAAPETAPAQARPGEAQQQSSRSGPVRDRTIEGPRD